MHDEIDFKVPLLTDVLRDRPNALALPRSAAFVPDPAKQAQAVVIVAYWNYREVRALDALLAAHPNKLIRVVEVDDCLSPAELATKMPGAGPVIETTPLAALYTHGEPYSIFRKDPIATLSRRLEDDPADCRQSRMGLGDPQPGSEAISADAPATGDADAPARDRSAVGGGGRKGGTWREVIEIGSPKMVAAGRSVPMNRDRPRCGVRGRSHSDSVHPSRRETPRGIAPPPRHGMA